jgi:ketosteroid isomerase-like protein
MKILSLLALVGLAIGFPAAVLAQEQRTVDPELRRQIEGVNMKFDQAQNEHDAVASAAFYTQNVVQVLQWAESGHPAVGQKAIEERYSLACASHPTECADELVQMYAIGDVALDLRTMEWLQHKNLCS